MGGNTVEVFRGSVIVPPAVTTARVVSTAFSTTLLPAVRAVIRRPSRMGTPEEMSVPRVRVNRATATFRIRTPNTGSLSRSASITICPASVL